MKTKSFACSFVALVLLSVVSAPLSSAFAQGTAFTYQGQLNVGTNPATGIFDLTFTLYGVSSGGSILAGPVTNAAVPVTNGLFVTQVDFGAGVFTGSSNWLSLGVRSNGVSVAFTTLSPRQQLTPTPYAIFAEGANAAGLSGTVPAGDLSGTYSGAITFNNPGDSFSGDGSGLTGLNASQLTTGTVPDARLAADVALTDATQTFTGVNSFNNNILLLDPTKTIVFPATGGANSPMMTMFSSGTVNADRMVIAHSLAYPTWGLQYQDVPDRFNFLSAGTPVLSINLGFPNGVGVGVTNPASALEVGSGDVRIDGNRLLMEPSTAGSLANDGLMYGDGGLPGINGASSPFLAGYLGGALGGLSPNTVCLSWDYSGNVWVSNLLTTAFLSVNRALNVDQVNYNNGFLNNGNTNGYGITFGSGSGEGIASKRTAGGDQYGLDFYTSFTKRMSIANNGSVGIGTTAPTETLEINGTSRLDDNTMYLRAGTDRNHGLVYQNTVDGIFFDGPFLFGYNGGALGVSGPNTVTLQWYYDGTVWISNNCSVASLTIRGGADLAEPFNISSQNGEVPQGAVVVIDGQNPGHLKLSDQPYDTHVAGVVSGANGIKPGIQMHQQGLIEGGRNVALTGRVYVQADASNGPIKPGDLLTTSSIPGDAMKVTDHARAAGAILGKAMTGLTEGKGMVLVLVTLQ